MGYQPENTLRSIKEALVHKVDMIEIDVYALPTGEVVVIHDDDVDRTTDGHGAVMESSFEYLRGLDAGNGQQIPTLDKVINVINRNVPLNVELKGPDTAGATAKIIQRYITDKGWGTDDFLVSSFTHSELRIFHGLLPEVTISALFDEVPTNFIQIAQSLGASIISPRATNITPEIMATAKQNSLDVTAWTVNDPEHARQLAVMGLRGLYTNYPDVIREALSSITLRKDVKP